MIGGSDFDDMRGAVVGCGFGDLPAGRWAEQGWGMIDRQARDRLQTRSAFHASSRREGALSVVEVQRHY